MLNPLAITALWLALAAPSPGDARVRIGLFSLLNPDRIEARSHSGAARLETERPGDELALAPGDVVRIRRSAATLRVEVIDTYQRVRRSAIARQVRIAADDDAAIELNLAGSLRRVVRGQVEISAGKQGGAPLRIVLTTGREAAVASIVAAETAGTAPLEMMKALAVVARTYLMANAGRHRAEGFDVCDTTHCQFYRGEDGFADEAVAARSRRAASETSGAILSFEGRVLEGFYTAHCGGMGLTPRMVWGGTAPSGYPYERIRCAWCASSAYQDWQRVADAEAVLAALGARLGYRLSAAANVTAERAAAGDYVRAVVIEDRGRTARLTADEFRRALGQRIGWTTVLSPTFEVARRGERFAFRGRGFGSQVGLCLAGAMAQAEAGRAYGEILAYYYPRAELQR